MSAFGELKNQLIAAISDRDQAAFRTTLVEIMTDENPEVGQQIVLQALETVTKKENSMAGEIWAGQIAKNYASISPQEQIEKIQQIHNRILEQLEVGEYQELIDFVANFPTIYLLNKSISNNLENVTPPQEWKWLIYSQIVQLDAPPTHLDETMKELIADIEYYCYSTAKLTITGMAGEPTTLQLEMLRDENGEIFFDLDNYFSPKKMLLMFLRGCEVGGIVLRSLTDEIDEASGLTIKELRGYFFANNPNFSFEKQSPSGIFAAMNTDHRTGEPLPLQSDVRYC